MIRVIIGAAVGGDRDVRHRLHLLRRRRSARSRDRERRRRAGRAGPAGAAREPRRRHRHLHRSRRRDTPGADRHVRQGPIATIHYNIERLRGDRHGDARSPGLIFNFVVALADRRSALIGDRPAGAGFRLAGAGGADHRSAAAAFNHLGEPIYHPSRLGAISSTLFVADGADAGRRPGVIVAWFLPTPAAAAGGGDRPSARARGLEQAEEARGRRRNRARRAASAAAASASSPHCSACHCSSSVAAAQAASRPIAPSASASAIDQRAGDGDQRRQAGELRTASRAATAAASRSTVSAGCGMWMMPRDDLEVDVVALPRPGEDRIPELGLARDQRRRALGAVAEQVALAIDGEAAREGGRVRARSGRSRHWRGRSAASSAGRSSRPARSIRRRSPRRARAVGQAQRSRGRASSPAGRRAGSRSPAPTAGRLVEALHGPGGVRQRRGQTFRARRS